MKHIAATCLIFTPKNHYLMEKMIVENTITINAPAEKVWDVLTNPQQTKRYMFGCETVSNWKPGSPLIWQMQYEGKDFVPVKGTIVKIDPNKYLHYTVIDPNSSMPDIPENYLSVEYALAPQGNNTELKVTQSGFEHAANGEARFKEAYNNGEGWNPIMVQIKQIAEE